MIPEMILYLLKVNIALLLFYAGYYFILQRYTFHTINRFYLLAALVYSALYPLINLSDLLNRNQQLKEKIGSLTPDWQGSVTYVLAQAENGAGAYWKIALMIFWTGVIFMSLRLVIQLVSLLTLHISSSSSILGNIKFRKISKAVNPFSFWRTIYLNPDCHEESELQSIIEHEQVHVKQLHTVDVMLAELSTIFYWFNPGVWLMKKAVKANLEFITDQEVIRSGIDAREYQYNLLKTQVLPQNSMPVNNFHFLTIKKRIAMINKKPSNRINLSNYLLLIPSIMILVLITGISKAEFSAKELVKSITRLQETSPVLMTPKEEPKLTKVLVKTDEVSLLSTAIGESKTPQEVFSIDTNKLGSGKIEARTINEEPFKGKIEARTINGVAFRGKTGVENIIINGVRLDTTAGPQPIYIVDGKRMPTGLKRLEPSSIESIHVIKGERANEKYGADGKNGVIEIHTKAAGNIISTDDLKPITVVGYALNQNQKISLGDIDTEMIILDGKEITKANLDDIKVTTIGTIEVFKGSSAVTKYGEKAKDGVIVITTK